MSCAPHAFESYVRALLEGAFPDGMAEPDAGRIARRALERVEHCFADVVLPGYKRNGSVYFDHLHADQSAVFFYFASNSAFTEFHNDALAAKFMLLNKMRNGIVVSYSTVLPEHVLLIHTVGTVLGKAEYGDYFVATQGVTVGTNRNLRPRFGKGVVLYPGSYVIGDCRIGDRVRISAKTHVMDADVPDDSVAAGGPQALTIKASRRRSIEEYFGAGSQTG